MILRMHYYNHHMGDHGRVARHFSILEDGAYLRLASAYFSRMQPLPADKAAIYRLAVAMSEEEKAAVDAVLRDLFQQTSDGWRNDSFDEQIATYRSHSTQAQEAANIRWQRHREEKQTLAESGSSPDAMRTHSGSSANQEPKTDNQEPKTDNRLTTTPTAQPRAERGGAARRNQYPDAFEEFWKSYPRKVGKDAALKAWKDAEKRDDVEAIRKGVVRFAAMCKAKGTPMDKIPYPTTWLNAGRWRDEEISAAKMSADGKAAYVPVHLRPGNLFGVGG